MARLLQFAFYLFAPLEFLLPPLHGEILFDVACILLIQSILFKTNSGRAFNTVARLGRWVSWSLALLYVFFMFYYIYEHKGQYLDPPTSSWRALTHAWYILIACNYALNSRDILRFLSNLQSNPARFIALVYTGFALLASLILVLPISLRTGVEISQLDALFTTISAISGTGLVVFNTAETFSFFGQLVILVVIQAGGIGVITFSGILLLLIGKELGLNEKIIQDSTERMHFIGDLRKFVGIVALVMISFELTGAILLTPWMMTQFDHHLFTAFFHALFQSVSAFCTAGFSTLPGGMMDAQNKVTPLLTIGFLGVIGMLGLPTILSIAKLLKPYQHLRRLSENAKLEVLVGSLVLLFGILSLFVVEIDNPIYSSWDTRLLHSFFQSSMRNAGFNSVPIAEMGLPAILILASLMIIGGAPMSTAGGIRTSSLGTVVIFVISFLRGRAEAQFAGRRLSSLVLLKAVTVIVLFMSVLFFGFIALVLTQRSIDPLSLFFESVSALSVTGWSLGATENLNSIGRVIVIFLMLIGRIGLVTAVYALIMARKPSKARYPKGDFYVG